MVDTHAFTDNIHERYVEASNANYAGEGLSLGGGRIATRAAMTAVFVIALLVAPLAACGSPSGETEQADQAAIGEEIMADVANTVEAFNVRDAEGAVRSNAPDFVQMFHGQANADNAANLANTRRQLADPALDLTINNEEVVVAQAGDMAFYSNRYAYTYTDPETGNPTVEHGNWVLIYRRQPDGTMKIFREIISNVPAGA